MENPEETAVLGPLMIFMGVITDFVFFICPRMKNIAADLGSQVPDHRTTGPAEIIRTTGELIGRKWVFIQDNFDALDTNLLVESMHFALRVVDNNYGDGHISSDAVDHIITLVTKAAIDATPRLKNIAGDISHLTPTDIWNLVNCNKYLLSAEWDSVIQLVQDGANTIV
jgi:hypothetical protein